MNAPDALPAWDPLPDLIPVRMLNEFTYCPRLAYLEWVQGEFQDSVHTVEGRARHAPVDAPPEADRISPEEGETRDVESASLSAPRLGLVAIIDRVEITGRRAIPVDYKRGRKPDIEAHVYDPERVQLCAQGLVLEENGFDVDHGVAYFVESRARVDVPFDAALREQTVGAIRSLRALAASGAIPPPLDESPKCEGCSLVGICLPDEVDFLVQSPGEPQPEPQPRMILPSPDEALPVYVQTQGHRVGKSGGVIQILDGRELKANVPMHEISHLALFGGVQISTQAIGALCDRGIPVCFFSQGGWFRGMTQGLGHKNVELRIAQYRVASDPDRVLRIGRRLIADKIRNCRTLLRRNAKDLPERVLVDLAAAASDAEQAPSVDTLLGIEGNAARVYFQSFTRMLKARGEAEGFDMERRNRRPPRDPLNALLSLAYALLTKTWTITTGTVGLDPYLGFYHRPRYGRPALSLDLMEPFRPLVADSAVIQAVNGGMVQPADFVRRLGAVALKDNARGAFVQAYERRLGQEVRHPVFGYRITYRQVFEVQARLLARHLLGEIDELPPFVTR